MLDEGIADPPDRCGDGKCRKVTKGWQCLKPVGHEGSCSKDAWIGPVKPSETDTDIPAGD